MRGFKATVRLSLLFFFSILSYGFYALILILVKVTGKSYHPWRNGYMRFWSRGACLILNIRIQKKGEPPKAPFFLVSNHLSYIDIIPMYLHLDCTFVAKKAVRHWPLLGFMVSTMGVVFVDRTRKRDVNRVNRILTESMTYHQGVVVFPEGTTSGGDRILPFHSSLLQYPAEETKPVYTAAIRYKTDEAHGDSPAKESVCFYGARDSFHKHLVKLAGNRRVDCVIRFGDTPVWDADRKKLADKCRKSVQQLFEPM